jgi:uncharacterized protein involved in oxidation of intracellular sulfur
MHVLLIVNDSPYGSERPYQALRLAGALLESEDDLELTLYLTSDGVYCARRDQQTPQGYYNIGRMLKPILRRGTVIAARTWRPAVWGRRPRRGRPRSRLGNWRSSP